MSWLARSIANTLKLDDDEDDDDTEQRRRLSEDPDKDLSTDQQLDGDSPLSPGRGVKEDLSEITKTLTRQFWGVASFLAPPPAPDQSSGASAMSDPDASAPEGISGIRRDFAEIGGKFRTGISKLSTNIDVSEITKLASNFLQLEPEEDEGYDSSKGGGAIAVTDEVVAFVRDISMHPETWLDFPLPEDENHGEDFELSDAQQDHALAVEHLAPRLAALRIELCPSYMSEGSFWKIYFVLLHPRLEPHAAELLSTPEIVKARASLTYELKNRSNINSEQGSRGNTSPGSTHDSGQEEHLSVSSSKQSESIPLEVSALQSTSTTVSADTETEKHPVRSDEIQIIDKSVIQEEPRKESKAKDHSVASETTPNIVEAKDEDDTDDWLKEESSEVVTSGTSIPIENDEDVSFSDLEEDDDDGDIHSNGKKAAYGSDSSTKDSRDWVRLGGSSANSSAKDSGSVTIERAGSGQVSTHNSETKETNDWLDVDHIDVA